MFQLGYHLSQSSYGRLNVLLTSCACIDLFHHVIYFVKPVHQHDGSCINLYCVAMTYGRLRSGHMTHEKGLLSYNIGYVNDVIMS